MGRRAQSFDSIEDANAFLLDEYQRHMTGKARRRPPAAVAELAEAWYRRRERKGLERKTLAADRAYLDARIIPDWGAWKVDQVTVLDVQDWIDKLEREPNLNAQKRKDNDPHRKDPLSEGMVHKYRRALDGVLREGIRQGMISESPASADLVDVTIHRAPPARVQPVFTDDEMQGLWDTIDVRYRVLVPLGAYRAGLRIGEWAGLSTIDFNPKTRDLSFRRKVVDIRGHIYVEDWLKGRNPGRTIRLGEDLSALLVRHIAKHSKGGWVFPAPKGGVLSPGNFRTRIWKPAVEGIGRPEAKFHWLRHSNVSLLREEGVDLEAVSKHVGHASSQITSRVYSHQTDAINESIAQAGDRLLGRLELSPRIPALESGADVVQPDSEDPENRLRLLGESPL
jgi:integrase